jgi:hypothetical protein
LTAGDTRPKRCFTRDYAVGRASEMREIERGVLGCDCGATSWTTRAEAAGVADRCRAVVADGVALPFADASCDAIRHSDVLCCMAAKLDLLRECRRVAVSHARMVFS